MPIRMLTLVRTTYAVLGILKKKEAGYMRGVIDQLDGKQRQHTAECICNTSGAAALWYQGSDP